MTIERKRHLIRRAPLLALVLGFVAGGLVWAAGDQEALADPPAGANEQTNLQPSFPSPPDLSSDEMVSLFTDDAYLIDFTRTYGPEVAVARLSELQEVTGRDCHYPAHAAGQVAYEMFGPKAFAYVGHACQSGAMHSVVESVLRDQGTDDLGSDVDVWCENAKRAFFRHNCVHGIGHGLLVWVEYELPDALALCDLLVDEEDRYSCHGGVFMENVRDVLSETMAMKHEHPERYLKADDPHYPCDILEEEHLPACYFYQSSVMYEYYGREFAPVAKECAALPEHLQTWCFRSMGRDAGHQYRDEPSKVNEVCELGPELAQRLDCLEEAVQHRFWETYGADWVIDFCGLVEGSEESVRCYWKISQRASELYDTPREFREFCGRFEDGYLWLCDFVLFQQLEELADQGRAEWINDTPAEYRTFRDRCVPTYGDEYCDLAMYFKLEQVHQQGRAQQLD